jgi:hypothetical protein
MRSGVYLSGLLCVATNVCAGEEQKKPRVTLIRGIAAGVNRVGARGRAKRCRKVGRGKRGIVVTYLWLWKGHRANGNHQVKLQGGPLAQAYMHN